MLKKIWKIMRASIIGLIWTYVFLIAANLFLIFVWNFNLFSTQSWRHISYFWNHGGIIRQAQDYVFLLVLCSLPIFWLRLWFLLLKIDYLDILFTPVSIYNNFIIRHFGNDSKRIILKNLKPSRKTEEVIKEKIERIKTPQQKEVDNIRREVQEKITSSINHKQ